ncbi:hypothetical protein QOT17_005725 [Balamuthia mandrillaris]
MEEEGGGLTERIPPEVLSLVLAYLTDPKDIGRFACTCTTAKALIKQNLFACYGRERKKELALSTPPVPTTRRSRPVTDMEELLQPQRQDCKLPLFLGGLPFFVAFVLFLAARTAHHRTGSIVTNFSFLIICSDYYSIPLHVPFRIERLTILYALNTYPTYDLLCQFDAILVIGGGSITNNHDASDLLARYIKEDRGGVVIARAANQRGGTYCVHGDFLAEGLHPLIPDRGDLVRRTLGRKLRPNHPILYKVEEVGQIEHCQGARRRGHCRMG